VTAQRRVDFLVAGVQKGGTTALFDYLSDWPALQLPAVKEAHFFDDEERVDWSAPDYFAYHTLFRDDGRLWGEATPIYLYWPNALERIAAYNPAIKLILVFRDPIERAWSHWKMEYARGKERDPFAWCIREGRARMAAGTPYPGFHRVYSYVERGFYGRQLARVKALFGREQLLLLTSDQLRHDPATTLGRIADFLGVPTPDEAIAPRLSRTAARIEYPSTLAPEDVAFLQRQFKDEMSRYHELDGPQLGFPGRETIG
jgi:hypothetical protein